MKTPRSVLALYTMSFLSGILYTVVLIVMHSPFWILCAIAALCEVPRLVYLWSKK